MVNVEEKIRENYNRFIAAAIQAGNLCALRGFTYADGGAPDYTQPLVQSYYNLRYLYGYTYEYMTMYNSIFNNLNPGRTVSVLSIGCGGIPDYLGLKALPKYQNGGVDYVGVDLVNWVDCTEAYPCDSVRKVTGVSAADYLDRVNVINSDIVAFPKSISEFSEAEISRMENRLSNIRYGKNKLCLCAAIRKPDGRRDIDMNRLTRFAEAVSRAGYVITGGLNQYYSFPETRGLCAYEPGYHYPQDVLDSVTSINNICLAKNNCQCAQTCTGCMSRKPILRSDNVCYMIINLERRWAA